MYARGEGVPQDLSSAYMWALLAAETGGKRQVRLCEEVACTLTPSQKAEGLRLAQQWRADHPIEPPPLPAEDEEAPRRD